MLAAALLCAVPAAYADGITVLNQQSYPEVGGLWTVRFETFGAHDLAVSGAEGTVLGAGGDVWFVELRDGTGRATAPDGQLVFAGYGGGGVSEFTVRVNTPGPHALLFEFGGEAAVARNYAYPRSAAEIGADAANGPRLAEGDEFGSSAAAIGDLDRDGVEDLAVGAPGADAVHILYLSPDGTVKRTAEIGASAPNGPRLARDDFFGSSVAAIGDLDRDGVEDLAVGAPGADAVHILYLSPDGTVKRTAEIGASAPNGPRLARDDFFGSSVAAIGDLDRDGAQDLAVGASAADAENTPNSGAVHILYLNSDGTVKRTAEIGASAPNGPRLARDDFFGSSVAAIGDLDRDGVKDLAVGAFGDDEGAPGSGAVHILYLSSDGTVKRTAEIDASTPNGPQLARNDFFGGSVAALGDVDLDGAPDIAVGAAGDDEGAQDAGAVHLLYLNQDGTVKRTAEINASTPDGPRLEWHDNFGRSVAALGDIDRDGAPDIAVGSVGDVEGSNTAGAVHIVRLGTVTPLWGGAMNFFSELEGSGAPDRFGSSVASIGDLDRDGVGDLAVGAPGDDAGAQDAGAVHLLLLTSTGTAKRTYEIGASTQNGPQLGAGAAFGSAVHSAGDLDGDGVADLLVGAPGAESAYVVLLNSDGSAKGTYLADGATVAGLGLGGSDMFGSAAAAGLDTDGDGAAELAVGAPLHDGEGAVYVLSAFRPAFVTGVGSAAADGTYGQGSPITITVEFSEPVQVTGAPALLMETGATDRRAAYVSGSGTGTLSFRYVVQYGDSSPDLGYVGRSSLLPLGGAVGASSRTAALDLPVPGRPQSLSFSKSIVIDGIRPVLDDATPNLDLSRGTFTFDFDEQYDIPSLDLAGISVRGSAGSSPVALSGASVVKQVDENGNSLDTHLLVLRLTGAQRDSMILDYIAHGRLFVDVSGSAISDVHGNAFAGLVGADLEVTASIGSDTASFSDSARAYKSGVIVSGSPAFSDSARAFKSGFEQSSSPQLSDSASRADMKVSASSDTAAFSDSARAFKSGSASFSSPQLSDSASRADMKVSASSDTAAFSDSARAYRSGIAVSDSPAPSSSASYSGLFVQGPSDMPQFSDSARAFKSGMVYSDSPVLSDSASFAGMLAASSQDSITASDSARAYKSSLGYSSAPEPSDSVRWGSARNAFDSDAPVLADSALARVLSMVRLDSPSLSDSARTAASALLLSDSPLLQDGARLGAHPSADAGDAPAVSDGAAYRILTPAPEDRETTNPARSSGGGPARGTGGAGAVLAVIHSISYERCSDEPYAAITVSPSDRITVTVEQAGTVTAARPSGQSGGAPDSSVWVSPIAPDAGVLQIRAAPQRGGPATADSQSLETDSCSGFVKYTAFGAPAAPGPQDRGEERPGAEPEARPAAAQETAPETEPALGTGQAARSELERQAAPPEPARLPAAPPEPARPPAAEPQDGPDLTREPAAPQQARREPAAFQAWHAVAAMAAAAPIAALAIKLSGRAKR